MPFPVSTYSNSLLPFYAVTGVKALMLEGYIITRVIAYGSLVAIATQYHKEKTRCHCKTNSSPTPPGIVSSHKHHPKRPPAICQTSRVISDGRVGARSKSSTEYSKRHPPGPLPRNSTPSLDSLCQKWLSAFCEFGISPLPPPPYVG